MEEGTRAAWALSEEAVGWLRENYQQFEFWVERDLVWTLQTRLRTLIRERGLPFTVLSDYGMLPDRRRWLSADLVVRDATGQVLVAAEFKYEPSHLRPEFCSQPGKLRDHHREPCPPCRPRLLTWSLGTSMSPVARPSA